MNIYAGCALQKTACWIFTVFFFCLNSRRAVFSSCCQRDCFFFQTHDEKEKKVRSFHPKFFSDTLALDFLHINWFFLLLNFNSSQSRLWKKKLPNALLLTYTKEYFMKIKNQKLKKREREMFWWICVQRACVLSCSRPHSLFPLLYEFTCGTNSITMDECILDFWRSVRRSIDMANALRACPPSGSARVSLYSGAIDAALPPQGLFAQRQRKRRNRTKARSIETFTSAVERSF